MLKQVVHIVTNGILPERCGKKTSRADRMITPDIYGGVTFTILPKLMYIRVLILVADIPRN
jgi:hypothetical protein